MAEATAQLEALRARGAERFDPVRFRYLEALARRAAEHRDAARQLLERRLDDALAEFERRFASASAAADEALADGGARFPQADGALRGHREASDFSALRHLLARLEARGGASPLAELLAGIGRHAAPSATAAAAPAAAAAPPTELKALSYFRDTWSKLSVDQQLSRALAQAPENAGPLNSHFLVLQALTRMRDISPDYLRHFIAYADGLLWLEQADAGRAAAAKGAARGERKRKPARGGAA